MSTTPLTPTAGPEPASVAGVREWLAGLDVETLGAREALDLVAELERLKGAASAAQARAVESVRAERVQAGGGAREEISRSLGSEVALARRESPTGGDRFVGIARALAHELPQTRAALTAGVIGERHVLEVVQQSATLDVEDRRQVDARLAPLLGRLSPRALSRAARRVAAELDAGSIVRRMERAVASRRVTVRPAPDGMAYLSILGPLPEVVGAHAALTAHATAVTTGQCPTEQPQGRTPGQVAADTALQRLSGRAPGQPQPVEVHLVITDQALLGTGDPARTPDEPARIPGHGPLPAPLARTWLRNSPTPTSSGSKHAAGSDGDQEAAWVWLRRLYTGPDGRDLVAMDSRRRTFTGLLRRLLILRDDVCATPWCDAPIVHADHAHPARDHGPTTLLNGSGLCARCNHTKETPGWTHHAGTTGPTGTTRQLDVTTPSGHTYQSTAPPLLGWGSDPPPTGTPATSRDRLLATVRQLRAKHPQPEPEHADFSRLDDTG